MNPAQLLQHFDRISEAPDAVARLRRFVLDLAVRGKLVEQDPDDEPAGELLKRIQVEKRRHAKQGKLEKTTTVAQSQLDTSFLLPSSWVHTYLGEVTQYGLPNKIVSSREIPADTWVLDLEDIEKDTSRLIERVPSSNRAFRSTKTIFQRGDVLFGKLRPYLNKVLVADQDGVCTTEIVPIRGYCDLVPEYTKLVLKSPLTMERVDRLMYGMKMPRLGTGDAATLNYPLPPIAEQHRIVAKVDELMALCDQLEAAKNERELRRDHLVAASLHRIGSVAQPSTSSVQKGQAEGNQSVRAEPVEDLATAARFHLNHLPRLTTRPEHIKQLRQTLLNLAVRGRLVPQDPNDEPAVELLLRKVRLPNGYTRRRKILKESCVDAPASLFPVIPSSWEYTDIQSLYDLNAIIDYADGNHGALYPRSNEFGEVGIKFVTAKDLLNGRVIWESTAKLNEERANQLPKGWSQGGDVLLTHNATVGRVARVESNAGRFLLGTSVTYYRLNSIVISPDFFYFMLQSSMWQGQLEAIMAQTTRNQVSIQKQAFFRIAIPPLAEQHRIVAKVDELMSLCEQLEAQLTTTQTDSRRLLEAVLRDALTSCSEEAIA